jgi:hypothetical protein
MTASRTPAPWQRPRGAVLLVVPAVGALVAGIAGGLLRAGLAPGGVLEGAGALLGGRAIVGHATLMIGGFLGTVIGLERAIALRHALAFTAPLASAAGVLALLAGAPVPAAALMLAAALAFCAANVALVAREPALHTGVLLAAAACWAAGTWRTLALALAPADGFGVAADVNAGPIAAGLAFLVLTVAAERLEMTRLMRRSTAVKALFVAIVAVVAIGVALTLAPPSAPIDDAAAAVSVAALGPLLFGAGLAALGAWLLAFDIARRTVTVPGLPRYMAACLLAGHAWLVVAGLAWIAVALGLPARDAALHALGLGFVFSMVMGHAPVVLPAVAGVRVRFGARFWAPFALLHATLLVRLLGGALDPAWRAAGAAGNAFAIAVFVATVASAIERRRRDMNPARTSPPPPGPTPDPAPPAPAPRHRP